MGGLGVIERSRLARWWRRTLGCSALHRSAHVTLWMLAIVALASLARRADAQDASGPSAEIVRGTVTGPDGQPVPGAEVTVTALRSGESRRVHTNGHGDYVVLFSEGEGEYVVSVRAIGFARALFRVVRPLTGDSSPVLESRIAMQVATRTLDTVSVMGRGGADADSAIGGAGQDAMQGALFSLDPSDLARLATRVPGVTLINGGGAGLDSFSVRGVAPDQNNVQVDGATTGAGTLPSGAIASASVATTTYDATRGGFAGAQMSITTKKGGDQLQGSVSGTLSDPRLAWTDARSLSPVPRRYTLEGSLGGPIKAGTLRYFTAFQAQRSGSSMPSLDAPSSALLDRYGIGSDTVGALASALDALGVPRALSGVPDGQLSDQLSDFVRLDWLPTATSTLTTTLRGSLNQNGGNGIQPLAFSSVASRSRASSLGLDARGSAYIAGLLDEMNLSLERDVTANAPYLLLPHGDVRVGAGFADGHTGVAQLDFGGGTGGLSRSTTESWGLTNMLHWLPRRTRHALTFGQELHGNRTSSLNMANPYGAFTFLSLSDLAANRPASYSRTISSVERATSDLTSSLSVDDKFHVSPRLQLEYGVRLDFAHAGTRPAYNPVVDSLFGHRTDFAPHDVGVSPRFGFAIPIGGEHAPRTAWWRGLRIDGGVGAFHGVIPPSRIASLVDATGLPDAARQLTCAGDATPVPDWGRYASDSSAVPSSCLDGTAPVEFSSDRPQVMVFDPGYRAPTSWRGTLGVSGIMLDGWQLSASSELSWERNAEGHVDLNLRRTPAFTLPDEGGRPVYATPDAIVPGTGVVAPGASRLSDAFGTVSEIRSDLRTRASQVQLSLSPPDALFGKINYNLQYTHSTASQEQRGFDGTTAGDPFQRAWAPSTSPRDQLTISANLFAGKWGGIDLRTQVSSGVSYTPMVAGDINGDGLANDQAFVFDPTTVGDSAMAAQMSSLLATAPSAVRSCLERQLGQIAARNSCHTGWLVQPSVQLNLPTLPFVGHDVWLGDHFNLTVTAENAVGALLRLVGLGHTSLGWAFGDYPLNPTLLYVDGFDPNTDRFHYRVNQDFGYGGRRAAGGANYLAPFQVVIAGHFTIGGPRPDAMARGLGIVPSPGAPPLTRAEVTERLHTLTANPVNMLLAMRDSLLLTQEQVARMGAIGAAFQARADTILAPLVDWIVAHDTHLRDRDLTKRLEKYQPRITDGMLDAMEQAMALLTDAQRARVSPELRALLRARERKREKG